ncbi:hypothetical protein XELAEV_18026902mg [Xenopus laevis]|uniref:Uncharacterized protein n=1 Tax=Xenopus laevis TaxID=8355 RepID=A0A974CWK7_XENLA|nr:hypothetical protein XELAEV_18026902mg [Xenopus laevis]
MGEMRQADNDTFKVMPYNALSISLKTSLVLRCCPQFCTILTNKPFPTTLCKILSISSVFRLYVSLTL